MKQNYLYWLSALALAGGLQTPAWAQSRQDQPAYSLGTSQALVQQLESQSALAASRRTVPTVALRVSASQTFTGKVNHREDLSTDGEYLVGEIQNVPGSSFLLRIEGKAVQGNIILRNTRQAYRYSADARGNVSVRQVDINDVICIDYHQPTGYQNPAPANTTNNRVAVISLQSYPGARGCVMLDFDGHYVSGTPWNNGNPINAASAGMTDAAVQEFWELVSEDFRPFSLNVTTDEAVFNSYPRNMRMRCIVTPTNTAAPGAGGVAYLQSFNWNDDTPCWVFMTAPKAGGEAASHEVGHTLGLSHDGRTSPQEEYYDGKSSTNWAPIMGAGYYKPVTHWSRGEYNAASQRQDDLAIMAGAPYNVGYRNDDHANGTSGATGLTRTGTSLAGSGIVERTADQDFFVFTAGAGTVNLNVNTVSRHGDLDIVARLYNSGGGLIGTYDAGGLNTSLSVNVAAGTYYVSVDGTGAGNPATDGYSDYGSLGRFTISGSAPVAASGVATMYKDCNYGGAAVALPAGDYNLGALQARGILNDDISSLQVNGGYQVVLYENDNFTGAAVITGSNTCLVGAGWNDRATSLRVQPVSGAFSRQLEAESANVNSGMTVEACTDAGGGQNMGYVDAADYLVFNAINFPTTGTYTIEYRVASPSGGTVSSDLNAGAIQLGNTAIPATGGWQSWTTVSRTATINAGTYNFGVYAQTGGWNINWIRISKAAGARPTLAAPNDLSSSNVAEKLALYPNPVVDRLSLTEAPDFVGGQVRILSFDGLEVWHGTYDGAAVDVSALKPGLYTMVLSTTANRKLVSRFSKE